MEREARTRTVLERVLVYILDLVMVVGVLEIMNTDPAVRQLVKKEWKLVVGNECCLSHSERKELKMYEKGWDFWLEFEGKGKGSESTRDCTFVFEGDELD